MSHDSFKPYWILGNIFPGDSIDYKPFQQQKFPTKWIQSKPYWSIDYFNARREQPIKTRTLYYITATYLPVSLVYGLVYSLVYYIISSTVYYVV